MTKIVLNGDNLTLKTPEVSSAKMTERFFQIYLEKEVIGEISFSEYSMTERSAEFNIKINDQHKGKGFSKEAVALLSDYYFYLYNGKSLIDCVHVENIVGQKYLEKLGFEKCGVDCEKYIYKMTKAKFDKFKLTC